VTVAVAAAPCGELRALAGPSIAAQKLQWLADKFVENQLPSGQISSQWDPAPKDYPHSFFSMEMYKAYAATNNPSYKAAADKYFDYYLGAIDDASCGPARHGIALANWRDYKTYHPGSTAYDQRMNGIYNRMMSYRWNEGSYFRCGYSDPTDPHGLDVAYTCDLAVVGDGLLSYYGATHNGAALYAAEGLGRYFVSEMTPLTYNGAWSSSIGTWVVGPSGGVLWEHHPDPPGTPVNDRGWGTGAQPAADYLIQLYGMTNDAMLKQNIQEKCVDSMKWQLDDCQFADGAVGMCGLDDKWMGMTAAAVQTYLWNRDAGFLSAAEIAEYQPKALAAADWMIAHLDDDCLARSGYYQVTGQSQVDPRSHGYWGISWCLEPLIRYNDLTPVPEPSAIATLAVGLVSLLGYAWRKRRMS
jgi:hypothetical protein